MMTKQQMADHGLNAPGKPFHLPECCCDDCCMWRVRNISLQPSSAPQEWRQKSWEAIAEAFPDVQAIKAVLDEMIRHTRGETVRSDVEHRMIVGEWCRAIRAALAKLDGVNQSQAGGGVW